MLVNIIDCGPQALKVGDGSRSSGSTSTADDDAAVQAHPGLSGTARRIEHRSSRPGCCSDGAGGAVASAPPVRRLDGRALRGGAGTWNRSWKAPIRMRWLASAGQSFEGSMDVWVCPKVPS